MEKLVEIDQTLQPVMDGLEQMPSRLDALSGAIWQNIDHENPVELEAGVRFKQQYNERRASLEQAMGEMLALLRQYSGFGPGTGVESSAQTPVTERTDVPPEAEAPAAAPDLLVSPVVGDLDNKTPFGFVLGGQNFTSASVWPLFYEALLQELYNRVPEKLSRLADEPGGFNFRGKPLFARVPDRLDDPLPIADALFAEADLDPEMLLAVIKRLIGEMGYPLESFKILLREKNRGTVETLSIAA